MDSFWAVDSALDILLWATAMWAALCATALYVDRAATPSESHNDRAGEPSLCAIEDRSGLRHHQVQLLAGEAELEALA